MALVKAVSVETSVWKQDWSALRGSDNEGQKRRAEKKMWPDIVFETGQGYMCEDERSNRVGGSEDPGGKKNRVVHKL